MKFSSFGISVQKNATQSIGICGSLQGCVNLAAQARTVATHVIGYTVRLFKLATSAAPSAGSPLSRRCAASTFTTARTPSRQFHANARQRHRDASNMNRSADCQTTSNSHKSSLSTRWAYFPDTAADVGQQPRVTSESTESSRVTATRCTMCKPPSDIRQTIATPRVVLSSSALVHAEPNH